MPQSPIQVLLVEDSPVDMEILKKLLASSTEIKVVGTAQSGEEALVLIPKVQPDVICTDIHMRRMDGLEFIKQVMENYPRPILVISASVQKEDTHNIFQLLSAGAVDVFPKSRTGMALDYGQVKLELVNKIKILSGVTVFSKWKPFATTTKETRLPFQSSTASQLIDIFPPIRVVAIGSSTGGPQALHAILARLPVNFPVPIICTQHICEGFLQGLIDWLALECRLQIKVATVNESPLPGVIYFTPERSHLKLDSQGRFTHSMSAPIDGHRPSVTVTFEALANFYGRATAGVLLTGMGRDGAAGMQTIAQAGGLTIAQDEKSSVVFGMPKEAIALGAAQHILPIHEIAPLLLTKLFRG